MVDARKPAAAGVFYPSERESLARTVRELLDSSRADAPLSAPARALVVPHGIYASAGPVIAAAWAQIENMAPSASRIQRVALFGPSHHTPLLGLAAPFADAFATPLGAVTVDRIAVESARRFPQLVVSDAPHEQEHSLEVELPFLQTVLPGATIVPLIVGDATDREAAEVLDALWDETTLAVVSTDLSEYYDATTAHRLDEATARAIEALEPETLGEDRACGHAALRALLVVARARGLRAARVRMAHPGAQDEVVGFGSFALG
jgi:AmmeMemoRadiSam system protein B